MARKTGENKNEKERHSKSSVYFLLREFTSLPHFLLRLPQRDLFREVFPTPFIVPNHEILSLVDYKEKIVIYTKKSGDKNLTESVHRKIS